MNHGACDISASRSASRPTSCKRSAIYQIQAKYLPNTNRFAESFSAPITVAVTPLTAASFRVTPVVSHGKLNKPVSFAVTALNTQGQPLTNYTGTVVFSSPTDSLTILPKGGVCQIQPHAVGAADDRIGEFPDAAVHVHDRRSRVAHVLRRGHLRQGRCRDTSRSPRPTTRRSSARRRSRSGEPPSNLPECARL